MSRGLECQARRRGGPGEADPWSLGGAGAEEGRVARAGSDPLSPPTDTCYVLSFSIIMLNTSLHNPNVRDKPPFERFVSMNRGINAGSDLPEDQLRVRGHGLASPVTDGQPEGAPLS